MKLWFKVWDENHILESHTIEDETDDTKTTYKTNYDIKKNVSKKYLVIKYTGYYNRYSGSYLKIENTLIPEKNASIDDCIKLHYFNNYM